MLSYTTRDPPSQAVTHSIHIVHIPELIHTEKGRSVEPVRRGEVQQGKYRSQSWVEIPT
jgi:hypothetical protein